MNAIPGQSGFWPSKIACRSNVRDPEQTTDSALYILHNISYTVLMCTRDTVRGGMIAGGLWVDRRHRLASRHQPRRRRDCLGDLVQVDGSDHAWFENRGERCTLLAFVTSESAFDYFRATRSYCLLQR